MKTETTATSVSPKEMSETANSPRIQTYKKSLEKANKKEEMSS